MDRVWEYNFWEKKNRLQIFLKMISPTTCGWGIIIEQHERSDHKVIKEKQPDINEKSIKQ